MNSSRVYSILFAVAFCGLVSAQVDVPHGTANMSSISDKVPKDAPYLASCDWTVHKPQAYSSDDDWEITVGFHKEIMSMNMADGYPLVAEFKQNGTNMMAFRTVKLIEGLNIWPANGVFESHKESPMRVNVIPGRDSMFANGQWKCSVTMQLKGTDVKLRFMSKSYMASPGTQS